MQHQSSAPRATHARLAVHECGCMVEYVTDRHGEYPLSVQGCSINEQITAQLRSGELGTTAYLAAIKGHRGEELS
jgi:hypothetical protein